MKKFTFILTSMLFLLVGGVMAQTDLPIKGGNNWEATDGTINWSNSTLDNHYAGVVTLKNNIVRWSYISCSDWVEKLNSGDTHRFVVTIGNSDNSATTLHMAAIIGNVNDCWNSSNVIDETKIVAQQSVAIEADNKLTMDVTSSYNAVILWKDGGESNGFGKVNIASITREVVTASSVAAPTISPASSTYDGELSVTITKGEGNDRVVYSVSGADGGDINATFTAEDLANGFKVLDLTGTGNITVTATGYKGENASSEVSNTYTYGVPRGKETATVNYYQIVPLTMSDTKPAYFDFEDGTTLITGTSNIDSDKLSIVDCNDAAHTTATGSTKCMKIDLSDKSGDGNFYDVQVQLVFNGVMSQGHTYYVHFWTKADSYTNNQTKVRFQRNGNDQQGWYESAINDIAFNEYWAPYSYTIQPSRGDASIMVFDLGNVAHNIIYLDDVTVYDVTSGNTPVEFTSRLGSAVISASAFDNYAVGDYVNLNLTGTPTEIAYKEHAANDETAISNYPSYTALTQTNGNWLIRVTAGMKTNGLTIKGHDMTLNSADIYKKVVISELVSNAIASKYDNVVVELTRSFVKDTWNTVCLPFSLTSAQATQLFGSGYKLAQFTGVSGTTMQFTTTDSFVAGVPYLVKPTIDVSNASPVVLVDVNITAKDPTPVPFDNGNYFFKGTFTTKTFTSTDYTTSRFVATGNELKKPYEDTTLKSLRCYFTVPAAATARSLTFDIDEEGGTTSINTVQGSGVMVNGYYNLAGQRVAQPTKGLYIVNGKKVVIK